jgi:hypothetical protein
MISLGPSANKTVAATTSKTSVGSSSKANLPVSINRAESKKSIINPLEEIMENFDFKESLDQSLPNIRSEENSDNISNYFEEDFTACYGSVSYSSEDEWMSGL